MTDYPTVNTIAEHLQDHSRQEPSRSILVPAIIPAKQFQDRTVSVTGAACRSPGSDSSSLGFWHSLLAAADALTMIPTARGGQTHGNYVSQGRFVSGLQLFDHMLFSMGSAEVKATDPGHRTLLEVTTQALLSASYTLSAVDNLSCAVCIGDP